MTNDERFLLRSRKGNVLARLTIAVYLFSDSDLATAGSGAAQAIERYVAAVGDDRLKTRVDAAGNDRPFTLRQLKRDLQVLRSGDRATRRILYDSDPEGWVGEYSVSFYSIEQNPHDADPNAAHLLHFTFPPSAAETARLDDLVGLCEALAGDFPVSIGFVGYSVRRNEGTIESTTRQANGLVKRFIAVDPGYVYVYDDMRRSTFGAHWIDFVGPEMVERLGIRSDDPLLGKAEARWLPDEVLMIRNARMPPLGDVNRLAKDIGAIPDAARLLAPARTKLKALGEPRELFDLQAWLGAFDDRPSEAWDNAN